MEQHKVFISVGGTANQQQEEFVKFIEERLRSENLTPCTVGRNNFSADSPLKTVRELMNECSGILIIALERKYFERGFEKRGGTQEVILSQIKLATPWNQIEAGMAYIKGLPILVILENGIHTEGLLEKGDDWYVMTVTLSQQSLTSVEFNGVLSSWKAQVEQFHKNKTILPASPSFLPDQLTIGQLISTMKPAHLWAVLAALAALVVGAFPVMDTVS